MVVSTSVHNLLTVVCAYAPHHSNLVERAHGSVASQTVPTAFIAVEDRERRGPAWGRNQGVQLAETPLVAFLDADDFLYPEYTEKMLQCWQPLHYVYPDWQRDGVAYTMPESFPVYNEPVLHINSCIISKSVFMQAGGYKENTICEDTEFWFRVMASGVCGIRCPFPVVEYSSDGMRSQEAKIDLSYTETMQMIYRRYADMACCGKGNPAPDLNAVQGAWFEGAVLVQANWGGNQVKIGRATGTKYPRTGNGRKLWVKPEDQLAQPDMFVLVEVPQITEDVDMESVKAGIKDLLNG